VSYKGHLVSGLEIISLQALGFLQVLHLTDILQDYLYSLFSLVLKVTYVEQGASRDN